MTFIKAIFRFIKKKTPIGAFMKSSNYRLKKNHYGIGTARITTNTIVITHYPFEPSIAYPEKTLTADRIQCIAADFGLCRLYVENDIIFISATQKAEVLHFAKANNIPLIPYSWNWDWLLEPYLDTEITPDHQKSIAKQLNAVGLTNTNIKTIQNEVGQQMYTYNFDTLLWDWCSLGLYDVLSAMQVKYNQNEFRVFYKKALAIDKLNKNTAQNTVIKDK